MAGVITAYTTRPGSASDVRLPAIVKPRPVAPNQPISILRPDMFLQQQRIHPVKYVTPSTLPDLVQPRAERMQELERSLR